MGEPETVSHAAGREMAVQTIMIIGGMVFIVCAELMQRRLSDPDIRRTWRMRFNSAAERFCAQTAGNWYRAAERFRVAYDADTP